MGSENERFMLKLIKGKDEEIKNLKDQIESLKLEVFNLNTTIFSLENDLFRKDEIKEKMIHRIEQENIELSYMLYERRELDNGFWIGHPVNQNFIESQDAEIPFEKDLYMYGEEEINLQQADTSRNRNKRKDCTHEASTSRRN